MQHRAEILAELQAEFGKKKLLTPQDIAPHIARSPQAQANLRCRGRFPLAKKVQGRIVISIYDLADFLDDPESFDSEAGPASTAPAPPASPRLKASKTDTNKAFRRPPSLGKTLNHFAQTLDDLQTQLEFGHQLFRFLEEIELSRQSAADERKAKRNKNKPPQASRSSTI